MRMDEINARLAAIATEAETATGDALAALETEASNLTEERRQIMAEAQRRQQLRSQVAAGAGQVIERGGAAPQHATRTFAPDTAEYREAYLLDLQGRRLTAEQRAAVSASGAIPTQTLNKIIARLDASPLLSRIDLMHIPGNVSIPVEGNVADVSWVAMGTAATDSADTITTVTLAAYKLIKTVEITADVAAMAISAFEDWLVGRLANKMQLAMDDAVLNGTGSNQAKGIVTELSAATGTYTKTGATYKDLIKLIAALGTKYAQNAVFIMPRKLFYTDVMGIVDTAGRPIVHTDVESPAKFNVLGYPVILDDKVPADNILFGDLSAYKMNIAKEPIVESDNSVGFRSGSRVYRVFALADGKLAEPAAFVRYERAGA